MDSFARVTTPNTLTCNMSTVDGRRHANVGSFSPLPHQLNDKPRTGGKLSSKGETNVALDFFEATLGILSRTKERIGQSTRVALDTAKFGVAPKDGRIDYGEFATMTKKGNTGFAARTMRGNLNFNLADALGSSGSEKNQ